MTDLDQINSNILQELQKDARITNADLAQRVGLSPSACLRRVQELERKKVILGYSAVINPTALGLEIEAIIAVGLSQHSKRDQERFETTIMTAKEVIDCFNVTGAAEYILRVQATNLESFKEFHTNILGNIPNVRSLSSHIVMKDVKKQSRL